MAITSKNKDQLTQSILRDNPWKLMWQLSLPAIIGMSINGINSFFDALFVGQMAGQEALAAISLAFPLIFITGGLSAMIGVGGSSILSMAIGAEDKDTQKKVFGSVLVISNLISPEI